MSREQAYRYTIQVRAALQEIAKAWTDAPEIKKATDTALRATLRMKLAIEKREGRVPQPGKQYAKPARKKRRRA